MLGVGRNEESEQSHMRACALQEVVICNQTELEDQEDRYEDKLGCANLVPEDYHTSVGSKRPKER